MTADNILVLLILAGAVVLFVSEKLRVDLVALMVLITLTLTGLVTIDEAFSGFASPAVITVWSVYIISGALFVSGVADRLASFMLRVAGKSYVRILLVIMLTVGIMSSFMNNIGAVAILLPAVVSIGRSIDVAPSKLLIPMAFVSLLGGKMTLIGTPPNILATSIMETYGGMEPFGFFDFTPMGILVLAAGILYFIFIGRHLLPERTPGGDLVQAYQISDYSTEVRIGVESPFDGQTLAETQLGERYDLNVVLVKRFGVAMEPASDLRLSSDDVLIISGTPDSILKASEAQGLEKLPELHGSYSQSESDPGELVMVEVSLAPGATLQGKTLKQADLRARYGVTVSAIRRQGKSLVSDLADVPMDFGDALLIQGPKDSSLT